MPPDLSDFKELIKNSYIVNFLAGEDMKGNIIKKLFLNKYVLNSYQYQK